MTSAVAEATESDPHPGHNDLGRITIDDAVVAKLAARAAIEVSDAGGAAPRVLGKSLDGVLGARSTSLSTLPKASADVDGSVVSLQLSISVRWPASVPAVTDAVRTRVAERVTELTGLNVTEIDISVTDLVTSLTPPPRVR